MAGGGGGGDVPGGVEKNLSKLHRVWGFSGGLFPEASHGKVP